MAEQDIQEAAAWYSEISLKLLNDFFLNLQGVLEGLKVSPFLYQKRYQEVRIIFLRNFPYGVYYTIEEDTVFVHAVLHTKRNPKTGLGRV